MFAALKRLKRYSARVAPTIEVVVTIESDCKPDHLSTATVEINGPYGWARRRSAVTKSKVRKAVEGVMAWDSVMALENPRVRNVRVYARSVVWWTEPEKKEVSS